MAITLPSDIVSEVARAADPARYQAAAQKLAEGASPADSGSFDDAFKMAASRPVAGTGADVYTLRNSLRNNAEMTKSAKSAEAHEQFEAYVLQTFVESMLPKDAENSFGKGTAGSVWKSMMAEQISAQITKAGGIGIAKHIMGRGSAQPHAADPVSSFGASKKTL